MFVLRVRFYNEINKLLSLHFRFPGTRRLLICSGSNCLFVRMSPLGTTIMESMQRGLVSLPLSSVIVYTEKVNPLVGVRKSIWPVKLCTKIHC